MNYKYLNIDLKKGYKEIAKLYELNNHLMTFYLDIYWRKIMVKNIFNDIISKVNFENIIYFIDICVGTGDLLFEFISFLNSKNFNFSFKFLALDFSVDMVKIAKSKLLLKDVIFILADVAKIPIKDKKMDISTISLGIRNLRTNDELFEIRFREIYRIMKDDGVFWGLETSRPPNKIIRFFSDLFSAYVATNIAKVVSKNIEVYGYLADSIRNFYEPHEFKDFLLNKIKFKEVSYKLLTFGVVAIHKAIK
jgi:demethylmenaquinone methyltransferase/2-methoxy-6-polyprenyl-1,4-benzoquinol methylase